MHSKASAACITHSPDKIAQLFVAIAPVDANPMLDRDGSGHRITHSLHAVCNQRGVRHQASANHIVLNPITRAADVKIDFVITCVLSHARARSQIRRHTATQLQGQRMLSFVMTQKTLGITIEQRPSGDHLGVQQRIFG